MKRIYCDTNILLPIFVKEPESRRIEAWLLEPEVSPITSDLGVLEFAAAISRLIRERRTTETVAKTILRDFDEWRDGLDEHVPVTPEAFATARTIVERPQLGVRGPDALHLALVTETGLPFATFDKRLRLAAGALGLPVVEPPSL